MKNQTQGEDFREVFTYENFKRLIVKNQKMEAEMSQLVKDNEDFKEFMF